MCQICTDVFKRKDASTQYNLYLAGSLKKIVDTGLNIVLDMYIMFDNVVYFVASINPIVDLTGREIAKAVNLSYIGSFN